METMLLRKKCGKRLSSAAGGGAQRLFDSQIELFQFRKKQHSLNLHCKHFLGLIRLKLITKPARIPAIQLEASAQSLV